MNCEIEGITEGDETGLGRQRVEEILSRTRESSKGQEISRRDCLGLLGSGAATLFTLAIGRDLSFAQAGPTTSGIVDSQSVNAIQGNVEQLKELWASRVYARNYVQFRTE